MNKTYWDNVGVNKTFTHVVYDEWLQNIPFDTNILDFGCGYGRITKQLLDRGYKNIIGYDQSNQMIRKARAENRGPYYTTSIREISKQKFGLVICFALFTSCPKPEDQGNIKNTIESLTEESAYLYISDYFTSQNTHYSEKYEQKKLGIYGCFGDEQTVVFRHHKNEHFDSLFPRWSLICSRNLAGRTLNGNHINISQILYKKVN